MTIGFSPARQRRISAATEPLHGRSPLYSSIADQRFSYCLYGPAGPAEPTTLLIAVHGTERDAVGIRDAFIQFADRTNIAILAPLFPAGIDDPADLDNYKFIDYHGIRFDRLLFSMIDEATARLGLAGAPRIYLCGFSGGAQFAHRFYYLHPKSVDAVSIAAPGRITEADDRLPWWHGTADTDAVFGTPIRPAELAAVPVHIVVGSDDVTADVDRRARATRLATSLREHGVRVMLDVVDGAAHELEPLMPSITDFFEGLPATAGQSARRTGHPPHP